MPRWRALRLAVLPVDRYRGFWGAARAADAAGHRTKATEYYGQLVELSKHADTERRETGEAKAFREMNA